MCNRTFARNHSFESQLATTSTKGRPMSLWTSVNELKNLSWVELSHQVNNDSPY